MKDPLIGVIFLTIIGLTLFERFLDALMFAICMVSFGFVVMEIAVWMGVGERK